MHVLFSCFSLGNLQVNIRLGWITKYVHLLVALKIENHAGMLSAALETSQIVLNVAILIKQ